MIYKTWTDLESMVNLWEIDEQDGIGLDRVERPLADTLENEDDAIVTDRALEVAVLRSAFRERNHLSFRIYVLFNYYQHTPYCI